MKRHEGQQKGASTRCKRNMRVNVSLLLNMAGDLVTEDMKKTEVLNVFSASDFTDKICLQESPALATTAKVCSKEELSFVEKEQVREHLNRLNVHKSMGPDGTHPQVLRKLTHVTVRPILIIFERLS